MNLVILGNIVMLAGSSLMVTVGFLKKKRQILRELRQLCREELPEYVQPVGYKFLPELPLTPVGKVDYRTLEEQISPRDY